MHLLAALDSEPAHLVQAGEHFVLPDVNVCQRTFQKILENLWRKCNIGFRLMNLKWFEEPLDNVWERLRITHYKYWLAKGQGLANKTW